MLIVDDSRFVRASVVRGLGGRFRLQQADSGERAWELLLLDPGIAVVLSDLSMPGVDGFELLRRVRASRVSRLRRLPFVVLSGEDQPMDRIRALDLGADRFVVKGAALGELADWIGQVLAILPDHDDPARPTRAAVQAPASADDPVEGWLVGALAASSGSGQPWVLVRLRASGDPELPARLRRGVRSADALHQEDAGTAWLLLQGASSVALRVALRFALLAAGRWAGTQQAAPGLEPMRDAPRVDVCLSDVDPPQAARAVAAIRACGGSGPVAGTDPGALQVVALGNAWRPAWHCTMPWAAVRQLVA